MASPSYLDLVLLFFLVFSFCFGIVRAEKYGFSAIIGISEKCAAAAAAVGVVASLWLLHSLVVGTRFRSARVYILVGWLDLLDR